MHGRVVNENTTLLHHFFNMSQTERVGHVPAHANEHDFKWVMKPLQDFVQGAVDQTLAEIKPGRNCRLCLLRQNLRLYLASNWPSAEVFAHAMSELRSP